MMIKEREKGLMKKTIAFFSAFLLLGGMLSGCASNQGHLGNRELEDVRPNSVRYDANGNTIWAKRFANDQLNEQNRVGGRRLNNNNIVGKHDNYRIEMNDVMAKAIENKFGFSMVNVLLTDNHAYVAVSPKGAYKSQSAPAGRTKASYMNPDRMLSLPGAQDSSNYRLRTNGMYDARNNGIYDPRPASSPDAAGQTAIGEQGLTEQQKSGIAAEVKRMKPSVNQVYISSKADFVHRLAAYAEDQRSGQSIQGYIAEFNAMAERVFPVPTRQGVVNNRSVQGKTPLIYD
ncbi:YhcN/YlaJ family sporulation lipoprotein [Paenibacillus protaetiae]|uniref:YhcN/YlaJ family sporulation lipoprotein n=1 Tax=Paenibacillus protaetiae TaxID=2509456 RepID=A0A4P6ETS2_9BACL|nr:YhcN/YlaJ family sporulation lipoprotein [Paenibacillus protaetiae]QAY66600.1 hypothetical protein ET464_09475 [Paenibacillus protaetiae]